MIAVPDSGYQEHAWCWKKQGHSVFRYQAEDLTGDNFHDLLSQIDVLVVINRIIRQGSCFHLNAYASVISTWLKRWLAGRR